MTETAVRTPTTTPNTRLLAAILTMLLDMRALLVTLSASTAKTTTREVAR